MAKELSLHLASEPDAGHEARDRIRAELGDFMPGPLLHDLLVVVSELVNNSVEHGPGEPIQVRLKLADDGTIRGEIEDQGKGEVAVLEGAEEPSRGLGLRMVDWLTDRWAVYEGSTHVWFEMGAGEPGRGEAEQPADPV